MRLLLVFVISFALSAFTKAQTFVIDGVKSTFVSGLTVGANQELSIFYRKDGVQYLTKIDSNLQAILSAPLEFKLSRNEDITGSCYNGKVMLLFAYKYDMNSAVYSLSSIDNNGKQIAELENGAYYKLVGAAQRFVPCKDGNGFYFISFNKVCLVNNNLEKVWEYVFPKGWQTNISAAQTNIRSANADMFLAETDGLVIHTFEEKTFNTRFIKISSKGELKYEFLHDVDKRIECYSIVKNNDNIEIKGFYSISNGKSWEYEGTFNLVLNSELKKESELFFKSSQLSKAIIADNKINAFLRDVYVGNKHSLLVFEKSFEDKFIVLYTDQNFKVEEVKEYNREHSDLKNALSAYVSLFTKGNNASKMLYSDYSHTIVTDENESSFLLMYEKIDKEINSTTHTFKAVEVSFNDEDDKLKTVPSDGVLSVKSIYNSFESVSEKMFFVAPKGKSYYVVGYTDSKAEKFIVKKAYFQ